MTRTSGLAARSFRMVPLLLLATLLGCSSGGSSSAPAAPSSEATTTSPTIPPRPSPEDAHISPDATGRQDGSSWDNAAPLSALQALLADLAPGGRVLLRADEGPYRTSEPLRLSAGGREGARVVVQGVDADKQPMNAVLVGGRTSPYDVDGRRGGEVFLLDSGADHLQFRNLTCQDQGTCFGVRADVTDLHLEDVEAFNVRRFLVANGGDDTASITGLVARNIEVNGFSKGAFRLGDATRDVLLEDVYGDSQRQDGDNFAMGVYLGDSVRNVVLRRVTMNNSQDSRPDDEYWNGDGFATERGVSQVVFEDTLASGSTDGGYDLKSTDTELIGAVARDNKRNFRLWASDIVLTDCRGENPTKRGGTGAPAQVWLAEDAGAQLKNCTFDSTDASGPVFEVGQDARLVLDGGVITRSAATSLSATADGGSVIIGSDVRVAVTS